MKRSTWLFLCLAILYSNPLHSEEMNECDRHASYSEDPDRPNKDYGVDFKDIKGPQAIDACLKALETDKTNLRYQYQLGRAYAAANRFEKAEEFYTMAAKGGYLIASSNLGLLYAKTSDPAKHKVAIKILHNAAEKGLRVAQYNLGSEYMKGNIVPRDIDKAVEYLKKAADQDYTDAYLNLGVLYTQLGREEEGYALEQKAADRGQLQASVNVGRYYISKKDYDNALKYLTPSAKAGMPYAINTMGYLYEMGYGVNRNQNTAANLYKQAIMMSGERESMDRLGYLYECGCGVEKNINMAFNLYTASAQQGYRYAFYHLCRYYRDGIGGEKDPDLEAKWCGMATKAGLDITAPASKAFEQ